MASLEYTDSAKRVMHFFHQSDYIVYVEGDDDVVFWEYLFDKFFNHRIFVKPVGGKEQLEPYIDSIISGTVRDFVAMDSDFSKIEEAPVHRNVIKTQGYSIENSLICSKTLREVVINLGKISKHDIDEKECLDWLESFFEKIDVLIYYDIANHVGNKGVSVVGDSCKRFFKSDKEVFLCDKKIFQYLSKVGFYLGEDDIGVLQKIVENSDSDISGLIRGHFLFSGALHFTNETIRKKRKKVSISLDSYFGALVMAFKNAFDESHVEYEYYKNLIEGVKLHS